MRYGRPIRLSPEAYANSDNIFHTVIRTHPEVGILPSAVRNPIWDSLLAEVPLGLVTLHAAVLMPDHIHLIVAPANLDLVGWIARWKSLSTRAAWTANHRGTVWQRRFYDRALRGEEEFGIAWAYVLRNPVDAGLVEEEDEWPHRFTGRTSNDPLGA
ncbi:MAG: transposase [Dehalococcoidia bacterium]|jgi:REP element-mobilizing transposase RayT